MQRIEPFEVEGVISTGGRSRPKAVATICPLCEHRTRIAFPDDWPAGMIHDARCGCGAKLLFVIIEGRRVTPDPAKWDGELWMHPARRLKRLPIAIDDCDAIPGGLKQEYHDAIDHFNGRRWRAAAGAARVVVEGLARHRTGETKAMLGSLKSRITSKSTIPRDVAPVLRGGAALQPAERLRGRRVRLGAVPVGLGACFDDLGVERDPVDDGRDDAGVGDDLPSTSGTERQVRCDGDRGFLFSFGEDLERQPGAGRLHCSVPSAYGEQGGRPIATDKGCRTDLCSLVADSSGRLLLGSLGRNLRRYEIAGWRCREHACPRERRGRP